MFITLKNTSYNLKKLKLVFRNGFMIFAALDILMLLILTNCKQTELEFISENGQVTLMDQNELIYSYQVDTKSKNDSFPRANYLHPLNDFMGNSLTEDFPDDHLHQRGIYWTWHQLYLNGESVADPWICQRIEWKVQDVGKEINQHQAILRANVLWLIGDNKEELFNEEVEIRYQGSDDYYLVDFNISIEAMKDRLEVGGSDDEKGYGGFSARLVMGDESSFFDSGGEVIPQNLQVQAGNWMGIENIGDNRTDVVIMYHPKSTASLKGWIIRKSGSMQNPVWPGRERVKLNQGDHFNILARLVVFRGKAKKETINKIYDNYIL